MMIQGRSPGPALDRAVKPNAYLGDLDSALRCEHDRVESGAMALLSVRLGDTHVWWLNG
jgi:hypothetical protein